LTAEHDDDTEIVWLVPTSENEWRRVGFDVHVHVLPKPSQVIFTSDEATQIDGSRRDS
jgi:hypothetical protein